MKKRILTALVFMPIFLIFLLVLPPLAPAILFAFLDAVAAHELLYTTGIVRQKGMLYLTMTFAAWVSLWSYLGCPIAVGAIAALAFTEILFGMTLYSYPEVKFESVTGCLFAGIVMPLCLSSIVRIEMHPLGRYYVLAAIMIPWINDAAAYLSGYFFGKHKMTPVISPHKTVEGAVGGVIGTVIVTMLYGLLMEYAFGLSYHYAFGAVHAVCGALISIVGDLSFSVLKRETGIKDYGKLFAAHGGVIDRFDSVIFAAPVIEILIHYLPSIG